MRKLNRSLMRCTRQFMPVHSATLILLLGILFMSCSKESVSEPLSVSTETQATELGRNILNQYTGLSSQTMWELQEARSHTARYRNIENAIADGYVDIDVIVQEMGHHYLKSSINDAEFDYKKPEILVYNRGENGEMTLVAVEYSVPIPLSVNAPAGFTGDLDVWDYNTFFGLWLLHAWVWEYNPLGVFNPTNTNVHTH